MKYKRVLLKISGEALAGGSKSGINTEALCAVAEQIKLVHDMGIELGIVVGGGNFWRGRDCRINNRSTSDYIGMLGTTMNALALSDALQAIDVPAVVMSAFDIDFVCDTFNVPGAVKALSKGKVVIFSCGTGHPYFSTDTGAALRAVEIQADAIFACKSVDKIYDKDPKKYDDAQPIDNPTYDILLSKGLEVMDLTAAALCKQNNIPTVFFSASDVSMISKVFNNEVDTIVIK